MHGVNISITHSSLWIDFHVRSLVEVFTFIFIFLVKTEIFLQWSLIYNGMIMYLLIHMFRKPLMFFLFNLKELF